MQTTKYQNMAGTQVQTSKVWKYPIFPDLARFSETGSGELDNCKRELGFFRSHCVLLFLLRLIFNKHPQVKTKHAYTL